MGWQSKEFGPAHEGTAGALLADGTEPKPVYLDAGSGSNGYQTTDWQVYDGRMGRPQADFLRGACSCGWRGPGRYPIDWTDVEEQPYDVATAGPHDDWERHISEVQARSIPLPAGLEDLLNLVDTQLSALVSDAPLAALRAIAALERTTQRVGREAAYNTQADEMAWDAIGTAIGLTEHDARSRLHAYCLRH